MPNIDQVPKSFFYYTSLNSLERKSWFESLIINHQIYFRGRDQLNDQNELRPGITFHGRPEQIREYLQKVVQRNYPSNLSPAKRMLLRSELQRRLQNNPESFTDTLHDLLGNVGILSLSESSEVPLLWSHYADGYRGVCVEFDSSVGLFLAAQKVHYTDTRPIINRLIDSPQEMLTKGMFTKSIHWAYELEWRVIARWGDTNRIERYITQHQATQDLLEFLRNQHGQGYYQIKPESIKRVLIGARVSRADLNWIQRLVSGGTTHIEIQHVDGTVW